MRFRRKRGFTLIEVVLIIALLGSIIAIAAPSIFGAEGKAKIEACQDQMDFIINGFQTHQFDSKSPYAFDDLTDGESKLNTYIAKAVDASEYSNIGFDDQVVCPSNTPTAYEAAIKDGKLFVYCPTHEVFSHASLSKRPERTESTIYGEITLEPYDNNWIIGDHESLTVVPLESEYYHMEIQVRLMKYDDGNAGSSNSQEYNYEDPEWYWPLNTEYYNVKAIHKPGDVDRPWYYDLDQYSATSDDLFFGMVIDYQENEGQTNFTSNALEIKNINSNAGLDMELDLVERDTFNSQKSDHATHQRDLMDASADWFIIDVIEDFDHEHDSEDPKKKRMVIHMQTDPKKENDSNFKRIFDDWVPIADDGLPVKFAFFVGNRDVDSSTKVGEYHYDSFPTPVQAYIAKWNREFNCGSKYENWIHQEYKGYDGASGSTIPEIPYEK
ncbi:hypothetical protein SANA_31290 [Gottschalkiaceae bacterium SANA]|nr:hypothetical protein SANA_31290 [Gottschalkiaceae bacterium SANA]